MRSDAFVRTLRTFRPLVLLVLLVLLLLPPPPPLLLLLEAPPDDFLRRFPLESAALH